MGRSLVGVLFVAVVASSACLAAANAPAKQAEEPLMNESSFLLAEESAQKLHELSSRYPDALPPEVVNRLLPYTESQDGSPPNGNSNPL